MKLRSLRGKNLASLDGEFTVDLSAPPLRDAGVFLIRGPTGAGKSTLLDAICLALYDDAPRFADARRDTKVIDAVDSVTAQDVRGILRRGASHGWAEVSFDGQDGRPYTARWEVRRSRDKVSGKLQAVGWSLRADDTGGTVSGKKDDVRTAVEAAVGLTFEQFRRAVLLAQGDFAALLHTDAKERAELLEKITGTELYSRISKRVFEEHRRLKEELRLREVELGGLAPLDVVARKSLEGELEAARGARTSARDAVNRAEAQHRWFDEARKLRTRRDLAQVAHDGAASARAGAQGDADELARVEAAAPLRAPRDAWQVAQAAQAAADTAAVRCADEAAVARTAADAAAADLELARVAWEAARRAAEEAQPELDAARALDVRVGDAQRRTERAQAEDARAEAGVVAAELALAPLRREEQRLSDAVAAAEGRRAAVGDVAGLAPVWPAVDAELGKLITADEGVRAADAQLTQLAGRRSAAETDLAGAEAKVEQARQARADAEAAAETARSSVPPEARAGLVERRATLDARGMELAAAEGARDAAVDASGRVAEARDRATKARGLGAQAQVDLAEAGALADRLGVVREEAHRALTLARATVELAARRAELIPGAPCPLCGSTEHPLGHEVADSVVAGLTARLTEVDGQLAEQQARLASARTSVGLHLRVAEEADSAATKSADALALVEGRWRTAAGADAPSPLSDAAGTLLATRKGALASDRTALAEDEAALAAAEAAVVATATRLEAAHKAVSVAEKALSTAVDAVRTAAAEAHDTSLRRAHLVASKGGALDTLAHLAPGLDASTADVPLLRARLAPRVVTWLAASAEADTATRAREALADPLTRAVDDARGAQARREAVAPELKSAVEALDALKVERAGRLGGRAVDEVVAALRGAVTSAESRLGSASARAAQAVTAASVADAAVVTANGQRDARAVAAAAAQQGWRDALLGLGLTAEDADRRLARDAAWITGTRNRIAELDRQVAVSDGLLEDASAALRSHEPMRPPGVEESSVSDAVVRARDALEAVVASVARHDAAVKADDALRIRLAEHARELESLRAKVLVWARLSDVVGSASGDKLRAFAQGLAFEALLEQANLQLLTLAPRYMLVRVPGADLDVQLVDRDMGDEVRGANTLSGGETFLVSLALALGLSELAAERANLRSLFIDEGLGALDPATLDVAIGALDALQDRGRQVGIISHVEGLGERLAAQVVVERVSPGRSRVRVGA